MFKCLNFHFCCFQALKRLVTHVGLKALLKVDERDTIDRNIRNSHLPWGVIVFYRGFQRQE